MPSPLACAGAGRETDTVTGLMGPPTTSSAAGPPTARRCGGAPLGSGSGSVTTSPPPKLLLCKLHTPRSLPPASATRTTFGGGSGPQAKGFRPRMVGRELLSSTSNTLHLGPSALRLGAAFASPRARSSSTCRIPAAGWGKGPLPSPASSPLKLLLYKLKTPPQPSSESGLILGFGGTLRPPPPPCYLVMNKLTLST